MSVDGPTNTVQEVNTRSVPVGPENPHGNAFCTDVAAFRRESQAQRTTSTAEARFWRIVNTHHTNSLGRPTALSALPGGGQPALRPAGRCRAEAGGLPDEEPLGHTLPLTGALPAGDYPNQNPGGDGLPRWTASDRTIEDVNVVLWYVFGVNHIPRLEDWPVMPATPVGFTLQPDGFFDRNPALDLPPFPNAVEAPKDACCR